MTRWHATVRPWVCRLYPERGSSLYVRVQVWKTHTDMLAYLNANPFGQRFSKRCHGACGRIHRTSYTDGRARRSPQFAEINLYMGALGMGVVTHEIFHATMAWAHRVGFDFAPIMATLDTTPREERITYAHSEMCRQFMVKATKRHAPYDRLGGVQAG